MEKKVKRKLNIKALLVILLLLYLIIMLIYYSFKMPIKNVNIKGNELLSREEITSVSKLKENSSLLLLNTYSLKKKIEKIPLVKSVSIKKKLNGVLEINIEEEKVLFFYLVNDLYVLTNNKEMNKDNTYLGIPTLINYTPTDILASLVKKLTNIDYDIIKLISEIEYSPDIKNDITIDEFRFILKMNDGNRVIINIANFNKLNSYKKLYATIDEGKLGTFYLDGARSNVLFRTYEAEAKNEVGEEYELPKDAA